MLKTSGNLSDKQGHVVVRSTAAEVMIEIA
jgi:hypothetical protein